MIQLKGNNGNDIGLLAIPIPDGEIHWSKLKSRPESINWIIFKSKNSYMLNFFGDKGIIYNVSLPEGKWEILGTVTKEAIDFITLFSHDFLRSLLSLNGVHFVNPLNYQYEQFDSLNSGENRLTFEEHEQLQANRYKEYMEAKSKVSAKFIILKQSKNK